MIAFGKDYLAGYEAAADDLIAWMDSADFTLLEAAMEMERLEAEHARLRAALEAVALADHMDDCQRQAALGLTKEGE